MSRRRTSRTAALLAVVALLGAACSSAAESTETDETTRAERREAEKRERERQNEDDETTVPSTDAEPNPNAARWTVLVFLAADNNLEAASLVDAQEMITGSRDDMNLIVVHDRSPIGDEQAGYSSAAVEPFGEWSGTRAYEVTPNGFVDLGISDDGDMTSTAVYEAFTAQVFGQFPSEHQAVFLWSHGGAWRGAMMDDSSNPEAIVSTQAMSDAIARGLQTVGDDQLDVIVYDACLMGELSSISAFADVADYLIASEESVPSHSLNYADLNAAAQSDDAAVFSQVLLDGYAQHAADLGTADVVTMSVIDLAGVDELEAALADLQAASSSLAPDDAIALLRAAAGVVRFGGDMMDLGQWAGSVATNDPVLSAALQRVLAAVDTMTVGHHEGAAYTGATGIAAYMPLSVTDFDSSYSNVPGTSALWGGVMNSIYNSAADAVANTPLAYSTPVEGGWNGEYLGVAAEVSPTVATGLISRNALIALDTDEGHIVLYSSPVPEVDDAVLIGGQFSPAAFGLATADGNFIQLITLRENSWQTTEVLVGTIPVMYTAPDGTQIQAFLVAAIRADAPDGTMPDLELYAVQPNGSIGPFAADPAGTLDALLQTYDPNNQLVLRSNIELFDADPLPADLSQLIIIPVPIDAGASEIFGVPLSVGLDLTYGSGESLVSWVNV